MTNPRQADRSCEQAAWRLVVALLFAGVASSAPAQEFQGGPVHDGVFETRGVPRFGRVKWRFQTGSAVRATPVLASGTLFVGSGDAYFYALDALSGKQRWRYHAGGPIQGAAAVADGRVFFTTRTGAVIALSSQDGRELWRVETGPTKAFPWGREGWDYFTASPTFSGHSVVTGAPDGRVYAFDAETGNERWRFETEGRIRSAALVADGVAYATSMDGRLYALDLSDGHLLFSHDTDGVALDSAKFGYDRRSIQSSPTLYAGKVIFGSRDHSLYAVDAATGERAWKYSLANTSWIVSSPAIVDGLLVNGSSDGQVLYALDADTGEERWSVSIGTRAFSSPAIAQRIVYFGDHDGFLRAHDLDTGELRWRYRIGPSVNSSPAIDDGVVFVGSADGAVYAIEAAAGPGTRLGVFWDETLVDPMAFSGHEDVRDHLVAAGYELLDVASIGTFLEERLEDHAPSVVVFALDRMPTQLAAPDDNPLVRRYLEAGGKLVWLGWSPGLILRDPETHDFAGFDLLAAGRLFGWRHEAPVADDSPAQPTAAGRRWGLRDWMIGTSGVDVADVSSALALDGDGRASAWVRAYGGAPGTGFVMLWGSLAPYPDLDTLRRVAEYGVARAP